MRLLLDTHAFLWLVEGNPSLTVTATSALADPANELFLSVASIWELAIKIGAGKLAITDPLDKFVEKWTATYEIRVLPILAPHALAVLSLAPHHADPFDRLLVAQAQVENMSLVSGDVKLAPYGIAIVW